MGDDVEEFEASFSFAVSVREPDHSSGVVYRDLWGDEFRWTWMLPYAWTTWRNPKLGPRIDLKRLDPQDAHHTSIGTWAMTIHLLALGLGWTSIRNGLATWRSHHYRANMHPILDYIKSLIGIEGLEALEIYFGVQDRMLDHTLVELAKAFGDMTNAEPETQNFDSYERKLNKLLRSLPDNSPNLVSALLAGGSDPLHLDHHISSSIRPRQGDEKPAKVTITRKASPTTYAVSIDRYAGWAFSLAAEAGIQEEDPIAAGRADAEVELTIAPIGFVGTFRRHWTTGRYFAFDSRYEGNGQVQVHEWGGLV